MSKTQAANPLFLYDSRAARAVRLVALAVIVATTFIGQPHASLSGHGLVILISLIVAAITQLVITLQATGSGHFRSSWPAQRVAACWPVSTRRWVRPF